MFKRNNEPDPIPDPKGYTDLNDLRDKLNGSWVVSLEGENTASTLFLRYDFLGEDDSKFIMLSLVKRERNVYDYSLDTLEIKWDVIPDCEDLKENGLEAGDAISVTTPKDGETVNILVKSIDGEKLVCRIPGTEDESEDEFTFLKDNAGAQSDKKLSSSNISAIKERAAAEVKQGTKAGGSGATLSSSSGINLSSWMSEISDNTQVRDMSIPGSHDAATFGVARPLHFAALSQPYDFKDQWNAGIRVFDLRPRYESIIGTQLFHDFIPCNMNLKNALDDIASLVKQHPTEGAIIILKPENNIINKKTGLFSYLATAILNPLAAMGFWVSGGDLDESETLFHTFEIVDDYLRKADLKVTLKEDLEMKDLRGKIAVIYRADPSINFRSFYSGVAPDWNDKNIPVKVGDNSIYFNVQDDYGPGSGQSDGDWKTAKLKEFTDTWAESQKRYASDSGKWFINCASGYVNDSSVDGLPDYAHAAEDLYDNFIEVISSADGRGIILQDYSGCNRYTRINAGQTFGCMAGAILVPRCFRALALEGFLDLADAATHGKDVHGALLADAVVAENFRSSQIDKIVTVKTNDDKLGTVDINDSGQTSMKCVSYAKIKATPAPGAYFIMWTDSRGNFVSYDSEYSLILTYRYTDYSHTAIFCEGVNKVTCFIDPQCYEMGKYPFASSVIYGTEEHCVLQSKSSEISFFLGDEIYLSAHPYSGYELVGWTDSKGKSYAPYECGRIKLNGDESFTAKFKLSDNAKRLKVKMDGESKGHGYFNILANIDGYPMNVDEHSCYISYGDQFTIEARENEGYYFHHWTDSDGNVYYDKNISVTMDSDKEYTVFFSEKNSYFVEANISGSKWGTVSVGTEGGSKQVYLEGSTATLTAIPDPGCSFLKWRNKETGDDFWENPLSFEVKGNSDYVAFFTKEAGDDMFIDCRYKVGDNKFVQFMKGTLVYENETISLAEHQYDIPKSWFWWCDEMSPAIKGQYIGIPNYTRIWEPFFANDLYYSNGEHCRLLTYDELGYIYSSHKHGVMNVCGNSCLVILPCDNNDGSMSFPENGYDINTWNEVERKGAVALPLYTVERYFDTGGRDIDGVWLEDTYSIDALGTIQYIRNEDYNPPKHWSWGRAVILVREVEP